MSTVTPFSQERLLASETDPELQEGVCVALCDHWLRDIKRDALKPAAERLKVLTMQFAKICRDQLEYKRRRDELGREEARREIGGRLGLRYEAQTTLVRSVNVGGTRVYLDEKEIKRRLASDLRGPGSAATWSLRFSEGGGHAFAGFCGLYSPAPTIHRMTVHMFDPNVGEYTGELRELDTLLDEMLGKRPVYQTFTQIHRTTEG